MSNDTGYRLELCGSCIQAYKNSLTYAVTELGSPKKCTCSQCKRQAYGVFCLIEPIGHRQERIEPHEGRSRDAR